MGETSKGSGLCIGAIAAQDLGLGDNVWLLGDRYLYPYPSAVVPYQSVFSFSFMKNVYSVFDFETTSVGFASLRRESVS